MARWTEGEMTETTNPYRRVFYSRQARWHRIVDLRELEARFRRRARYYRWYTKDWLPVDRRAPVLDLGCGCGQFVYFLGQEGFSDVVGVDVDEAQVDLGRRLGLNCTADPFVDYLRAARRSWDLISLLDVLEHFTKPELFELMELVKARLSAAGRIVASVVNAASPNGLTALAGDITHEVTFTATSLTEMLACHGLRPIAWRDPFPAPVTFSRGLYRHSAWLFRKLEALRLRLLGLAPPDYWSPVLWVLAERGQG
jgi:2-polyprenyl-3-methyl-5-hydroxy-6-metoxy-1,4-benzoquinol methylase